MERSRSKRHEDYDDKDRNRRGRRRRGDREDSRDRSRERDRGRERDYERGGARDRHSRREGRRDDSRDRRRDRSRSDSRDRDSRREHRRSRADGGNNSSRWRDATESEGRAASSDKRTPHPPPAQPELYAIYDGTVSKISDFGCFVELRGFPPLPNGRRQEGLVHVSQIQNGMLRDPSKVVKRGQPVKVKVVSQVRLD